MTATSKQIEVIMCLTVHEQHIARITQENAAGPRDSGLDLLQQVFPFPWLYLFELTQNALDAGASEIRIDYTTDDLSFEHNGRPFTQLEVGALCGFGNSTKGIDSVGFMGVGFKSVFVRFFRVEVTSPGWAFFFDVPVEVSDEEAGDEHPNWSHCGLPVWDEKLLRPDETCTRFRLSRVRGSDTAVEGPIASDVAHLIGRDHALNLAVLAMQGLRSLVVNGEHWLTEYDESTGQIVVLTGEGRQWAWQTFTQTYSPTLVAAADLAEFRRCRLAEGNNKAKALAQRKVTAFLPLAATAEDDLMPDATERGEVYASLPTGQSTALGMHINADWLVNITRTGFVAIESHAWQREIVQQIPNLVAKCLNWLVSEYGHSPVALRQGLRVLASPSNSLSTLDAYLASDGFRHSLASAIAPIAFLPTFASDGHRLSRPTHVRRLPDPLADEVGNQPDARPDLLFGLDVLNPNALERRTIDALQWLGFLRTVTARELAAHWRNQLDMWWDAVTSALEASEHYIVLFRLWSAVARLTSTDAVQSWAQLPCVRTEGGTWAPAGTLHLMEEELPADTEPGFFDVNALLVPELPGEERRVEQAAVRVLLPISDTHPAYVSVARARKWLRDTAAKRLQLRALVTAAAQREARSKQPRPALFLALARWARHRNRQALVEFVVVDGEAGLEVVPPAHALLADPYVPGGHVRRAVFPQVRAVTADYLTDDEDPDEASAWGEFFEALGVRGNLRLVAEGERSAQYDCACTDEVLAVLGVSRYLVDEKLLETSRNAGYRVQDLTFEAEVDLDAVEALAAWLGREHTALRGHGRIYADRKWYNSCEPVRGRALAEWVTRLSQLAWVPTSGGRRYPPAQVIVRGLHNVDDYEEVPIAEISLDLARTLSDEGVTFGSAVPRSGALRRLRSRNGLLTQTQLAELLREAIGSESERATFRELLPDLLVPVLRTGRTVPVRRLVQRVGARHRSDLNGFVAGFDQLDPALLRVLELAVFWPVPETTTGQHALEYLIDVWQRAAAGDRIQVDTERHALAAAYQYVLEDATRDAALRERWHARRRDARVYTTGRKWRAVPEGVFLDDLDDVRVRERVSREMRDNTATATHFGEAREDQLRVARDLGIEFLSARLRPKWRPGRPLPSPDLERRFLRLSRLLAEISNRQLAEPVTLQVVDSLVVFLDGAAPFPASAGLDGTTLRVVGAVPIEFAAEATQRLVQAYTLSQRGEDVPFITMVIAALDDEAVFVRNLQALCVWLGVPLPEEPSQVVVGPEQDEPSETETTTSPGGSVDVERSEDRGERAAKEPPHAQPGRPSSGGGSRRDGHRSGTRRDASGRGAHSGGQVGRSDGATRNSGAGEQRGPNWMRILGVRRESSTEHREGRRLGGDDSAVRAAVELYEQRHGRDPQQMSQTNRGFDIRSVDPATGRVRHIEIKGLNGTWTGEASVVLTRPELEDALAAHGAEYWLYVVERLNDRFRILPVSWANAGPLGFGLQGELWCGAAAEIGEVDAREVAAATGASAQPPQDTVAQARVPGKGVSC